MQSKPFHPGTHTNTTHTLLCTQARMYSGVLPSPYRWRYCHPHIQICQASGACALNEEEMNVYWGLKQRSSLLWMGPEVMAVRPWRLSSNPQLGEKPANTHTLSPYQIRLVSTLVIALEIMAPNLAASPWRQRCLFQSPCCDSETGSKMTKGCFHI